MALLEDYIQRVNAPVKEDAPFGEPIPRSNPDYTGVRKKIAIFTPGLAKPDSEVNEKVMWQEILEHSTTILETVSKDILIYCFFCAAMFENFGFEGLTESMGVFQEQMKKSYPDLYPNKPKMQFNAFQWFGEYFELRFAKLVAEPESEVVVSLDSENPEVIQAFPEKLNTFVNIVIDSVPNVIGVHPKFTGLHAWVKDLPALVKPSAKAAPEPAPAPGPDNSVDAVSSVEAVVEDPIKESVPAVREETAQPAPEKKEPAASEVSEGETINRRDVVRSMIRMAGSLRQIDLSDPMAYKLVRAAIWTNVSQLPVKQPPRSGQVESDVMRCVIKKPLGIATIEKVIQSLDKTEGADPVKIIESLENNAVKEGMAFWMDLQMHQYNLCGKAGWDNVQEVIAGETLMFTARMGEALLTAQFADGTPFISEEVKQWLADLAPETDQKKVTGIKIKPTKLSGPTRVMPVFSPDLDAGTLEELVGQLNEGRDYSIKWKLILKCASILLQDPAKQGLALAICRSCRKYADTAVLADVCPSEYAEMQFYIQRLTEALGQTTMLGAAVQLSDTYLDYVHSALWRDPSRFLMLELGL